MNSKCECGDKSLNCCCGYCHNCGEKFSPEDEINVDQQANVQTEEDYHGY